MEWDMKSGSSPWDWDNNAMLFPGIGLNRNENISNDGTNSASASAPASLAMLMVAATAAADNNNVGRGSFGAAVDHGRVFCREEKSSVVVARVMEDMKEPKQGDSLVDLKLGRRSDYEDGMGMGMGGKSIAATSAVSPMPSKRPRGSMQGAQTPCCQVQGCNADLKCCKDYHRRHKVCEMHSKSAKVRVAGLEQRFCQQCSRFHLLSEFDEGKRSCRKRLAGHNERRRKHQPGSVMKSARLLPTFHENGRPGNILAASSSFTYPSFVSRSAPDDSSDFKLSRGNWPRAVKTEYQSTYDGRLQVPGVERQTYFSTLPHHNTGRLLPFLQGPKTVPSDSLNHGIDQYTESGRGPICQALTLSSSSGSGVLSGLEIASTVQGLPGVSDSRCALSLLSSQPWSSRAPGSASLNMATRSGISLDQIVLDNQPPMAQPLMPGLQSNYGLVADKLLRVRSRSSSSLFSSKFSATGINIVDEEQLGGVLVSSIGGVGTFEGPGHSFLQGPNFRDSEGEISQDVRRTIDLMCMSSQPQTAEFQEQSGAVQKVQIADFQLMKPYESSFLDAQKML